MCRELPTPPQKNRRILWLKWDVEQVLVLHGMQDLVTILDRGQNRLTTYIVEVDHSLPTSVRKQEKFRAPTGLLLYI